MLFLREIAVASVCVFVVVASVDFSSATDVKLPRLMKAAVLQPAKKIVRKQSDHTDGDVRTVVLDAGHDVVAVARNNSASKFADFVLKTSWLSSTLVKGAGRVTVFAFSDDAYAASSAAVKAALDDKEHPGSRDALLQYHVAMGQHLKKEIAIHGVDKPLYSLYPSPPLVHTAYQPIHIDSYWVYESSTARSIVTASGAPIVKADLMASNGVVHILDKVMFPVPTGADMAQYLEREPRYSMLYAALQKANLTSALSTPTFKPLTLLAPSDAAFKRLSPTQIKALNDTATLIKVLTFHVVESSYYSAAIYNNFQLHSLQGSTIYFQKGAGGVSAEGKMVVRVDTTVTNGVVHELDGVMFPKLFDDIL